MSLGNVLVLTMLTNMGQNTATKLDWRNQNKTDLTNHVIPNDTTITNIDLSKNDINLIPQSYFNVHLPDLEQINLGSNFLSMLPDNWLSSLPSLEKVYIHGNRVERIGNATFSGLYNLQVNCLKYFSLVWLSVYCS